MTSNAKHTAKRRMDRPATRPAGRNAAGPRAHFIPCYTHRRILYWNPQGKNVQNERGRQVLEHPPGR